MEKMFFKMVDEMCKDYLYYVHKGYLWFINPNTGEWVVSYYYETKYPWWNFYFFNNIYNFLSMDINDRQPIRNWIESRLKVEIGLNCEPDRLPGSYDWSGDFEAEDVLSEGKVFSV
jgi:hypothetical protein